MNKFNQIMIKCMLISLFLILNIISVTAIDLPPDVTITPSNVNVADTLDLQIIATDNLDNPGIVTVTLEENGQQLDFKQCGGAGNQICVLNVQITKNSPGTFTYRAFAVDVLGQLGEDQVDVNFAGINTAPTINIPDQQILENSGLNQNFVDLHAFTIDNEDNDNQLAFSITGQSNQGVANCVVEQNRFISCTTVLNQDGNSVISVSVTDTGGLSAQDDFTLTVLDQGGNNAPRLANQIPNQSINNNQAVILNLTNFFVDDDGDLLIFTANNALNITAAINGELATITADINFTGTQFISFNATDPSSLSIQSNIVAVTAQIGNLPPILQNDIGNVSFNEDTNGSILNLNNNFKDPENGILIFTAINGNNVTVIINGNNATLVPEPDFFGNNTITINATDNAGNTVESNLITVEVLPVPDAPRLKIAIPNQTIQNGTSRNLTLTDFFEDVDGEELNFTNTAPNNVTITIDNTTKIATITVPGDFIGVDSVTFTAIDPSGLSINSNLVTINAVQNLAAPVIVSSPILTGTDGLLYNYQVIANDADNDPITFTLEVAPSGMNINAAGLISFNVPLNASQDNASGNRGVFPVVVKATDPSGLFDTQSYNLTISEAAKLVITEIEVTVDGDDDRIIPGEVVDNVKPGSKVKIKVEVENQFTDGTEIKDIKLDITIRDIDEGDDLDEDGDFNDLDSGDNDDLTLDFNIPFNVDEDQFLVEIVAVGRDTTSARKLQTATATFFLEIEKENHEISITRFNLIPDRVGCNREVVIDLEVVNTGSNDEDEALVTLLSDELGIDFRKTLNLEEATGNRDDDNKFTRSIAFEISENVKIGVYPITITTFTDLQRESNSRIINLAVEACSVSQIGDLSSQVNVGDNKRFEFVELIQDQGLFTGVTELISQGSDLYIILLIIALIIITGLIIFLFAIIIMRRNR